MGAQHLVAGVAEDVEPNLTLGLLAQRVNAIINTGVPMDAPIKSGYSPMHLRDCLYVEEPIDITTLSFEHLQKDALSRNSDISRPAWAEIERRINEA